MNSTFCWKFYLVLFQNCMFNTCQTAFQNVNVLQPDSHSPILNLLGLVQHSAIIVASLKKWFSVDRFSEDICQVVRGRYVTSSAPVLTLKMLTHFTTNAHTAHGCRTIAGRPHSHERCTAANCDRRFNFCYGMSTALCVCMSVFRWAIRGTVKPWLNHLLLQLPDYLNESLKNNLSTVLEN